MPIYMSFTVAIPVNYTSKFWELLEATSKKKKGRGLGMPLTVIFPRETREPPHNNRCGPSPKRVGCP